MQRTYNSRNDLEKGKDGQLTLLAVSNPKACVKAKTDRYISRMGYNAWECRQTRTHDEKAKPVQCRKDSLFNKVLFQLTPIICKKKNKKIFDLPCLESCTKI